MPKRARSRAPSKASNNFAISWAVKRLGWPCPSTFISPTLFLVFRLKRLLDGYCNRDRSARPVRCSAWLSRTGFRAPRPVICDRLINLVALKLVGLALQLQIAHDRARLFTIE